MASIFGFGSGDPCSKQFTFSNHEMSLLFGVLLLNSSELSEPLHTVFELVRDRWWSIKAQRVLSGIENVRIPFLPESFQQVKKMKISTGRAKSLSRSGIFHQKLPKDIHYQTPRIDWLETLFVQEIESLGAKIK
jgi:hypothetical protein